MLASPPEEPVPLHESHLAGALSLTVFFIPE